MSSSADAGRLGARGATEPKVVKLEAETCHRLVVGSVLHVGFQRNLLCPGQGRHGERVPALHQQCFKPGAEPEAFRVRVLHRKEAARSVCVRARARVCVAVCKQAIAIVEKGEVREK